MADALRCYRELERTEEDRPLWSLRVAECYHRLGRTDGELSALMRAADRYERQGFTREALALWSRVAAGNPADDGARRAVTRLAARCDRGLDRLRSSIPPPPEPPAARASVRRSSGVMPVSDPNATAVPREPRLPEFDPDQLERMAEGLAAPHPASATTRGPDAQAKTTHVRATARERDQDEGSTSETAADNGIPSGPSTVPVDLDRQAILDAPALDGSDAELPSIRSVPGGFFPEPDTLQAPNDFGDEPDTVVVPVDLEGRPDTIVAPPSLDREFTVAAVPPSDPDPDSTRIASLRELGPDGQNSAAPPGFVRTPSAGSGPPLPAPPRTSAYQGRLPGLMPRRNTLLQSFLAPAPDTIARSSLEPTGVVAVERSDDEGLSRDLHHPFDASVGRVRAMAVPSRHPTPAQPFAVPAPRAAMRDSIVPMPVIAVGASVDALPNDEVEFLEAEVFPNLEEVDADW